MSKYFQNQIDINFKVLGLNWRKKIFQDRINVTFNMLRLKRLFTQNLFNKVIQ